MNMLLDRYGVRRELVTIKPRLDATSLASLYDEASVFAFPSLYEGFGLPVIEALCHGLPVAALPVSTLPEILGDAGYPSRGSTPAEFADAIKRALTSVDDASKAAETALRSKQRALALDAISPVAQTLDLLKRL
jgi:alpha-1,3-rhamnosyl/mannosyltransferase